MKLPTRRQRRSYGRWDYYYAQPASAWQQLTPPQLFVGSFLLLVLFGMLGLKVLPGLYTGLPLGWLDALYTATSAVCVTGLIVVDTATYFTTAGQAFLLLLIQLGGLGMLTFTSLIIIGLGRRLSVRQEAFSSDSRDIVNVDHARLVYHIVLFTIAIEAAGALLLYALWAPDMGWHDAAWPSIFHSVSAFCNAGFSIFSDSLMSHHQSPSTLLVVATLIVVGGIGFLTLEEVYLSTFHARRGKIFRLSLHSRLVVVTTIMLIAGGWGLMAIFEWRGSLADMRVVDKLSNSLFMSITSRTAGFNTINYAETTDATAFTTILLMMIGGSPGSTAGGIKTTTFALIGLLAWSRLRGNQITSFWNRSVRDETVERAVGLLVAASGAVCAGILILSVSEFDNELFLDRMFEVVSAFNTVGLSTGISKELSPLGRLTTIVLMFLGRVGPLTFAAAITLRPRRTDEFRFAYEEIVVG